MGVCCARSWWWSQPQFPTRKARAHKITHALSIQGGSAGPPPQSPRGAVS
jgi:hypothetical protein